MFICEIKFGHHIVDLFEFNVNRISIFINLEDFSGVKIQNPGIRRFRVLVTPGYLLMI